MACPVTRGGYSVSLADHQGVRHQRDPITPGSDIIDSHAGAAWEVMPQGPVFPRGRIGGKESPAGYKATRPLFVMRLGRQSGGRGLHP
jgi:hypothetical protein